MNRETLRAALVAMPGAVETQPFGPDVWVYKVGGRMFALAPPHGPPSVTLKLEPAHGQFVRAQYDAVAPGYHMNKEHWNTIRLDGDVTDPDLLEWIEASYGLVVAGLPKRERERLAALTPTADSVTDFAADCATESVSTLRPERRTTPPARSPRATRGTA